GRAVVVLIHCNAGCDRTGEMVAAYRLRGGEGGGEDVAPKDVYGMDVSECGRPPNYYSTHAIEWFCIERFYSSEEVDYELDDCVGFATCKPFGDCEPT
ncbi:hypothetical protein TeGR_g11524, partial [Tetraparma gracilis]